MSDIGEDLVSYYEKQLDVIVILSRPETGNS